MPRFTYNGPPDEPGVSENFHALTGAWVTGEPRDIEGAVAVAWLRQHPHWSEVIEAPASEPVEE